MKTITTAAILCFFVSLSASASIECVTPYGAKTFVIGNNTLALKKENAVGRSISSTFSPRTKITHTGFTKTMYVDSHKYKINIADKNSFSELNDYLVITSPKGHKVTYPLNCN